MTAPRSVPVAIVGGGMAGLLLALLLRQAGQRQVLLLETTPLQDDGLPLAPSFDARSTALSAGTLQVFDQLGLRETLLEQAEPILSVDVSRKSRLGQVRINAAEEGLPMLGAVTENRWLGRVLLAAVARVGGIELRAPCAVRNARRQPDGYLIETEQGESIHCRLLVAADGAYSRVRQAFGLDARHQDTGHEAIFANIELQRDHGGVAWERFLDAGPMALLPLPGRRMALVWTGTQRRMAPLLECPSEQFIAALQDDFGIDRLGPIARIGSRHRYPLVLTHAIGQVVPFGVVVGNAAHTLHPVAGQGFNLSVRDLALLAQTVGDSETPGALTGLQRYHAARAADQQQIVQASRLLPELFRATWGPFAHSRQLGLVAMDLWPRLRSGFAARAMGVQHA